MLKFYHHQIHFMKFYNRIIFPAIILLAFVMSGCDKTKPYDITTPIPQAHFDGDATQLYSIVTDPAPVYNLTVGTTDVSNTDRTITYHVSSPSGAVEGTQYTIDNSGTVTIPAGRGEATIDIRAKFPAYASGRKDTLIFTLDRPSMEIASFMDTVTLIMRGPSGCVEDVVNVNDLLGDYVNTNETFGTSAYGPYTTSISSATLTSPTTATIVVENIFDDGWGPITFDLDWTDATNRTAIVEDQNAIPGSDAGSINTTYAGQTVAVRVPPASLSSLPGTYSYCDQTFTLQMQLGVTGVGWFNALYTVNMAR